MISEIEFVDVDLPAVYGEQPSTVVSVAPASDASRALEALSRQIVQAVKKDRSLALLRGVLYLFISNAFTRYQSEFAHDVKLLEEAGYDMDGVYPIESIDSYRAEHGFTWDSHSNMYDLQTVARHYIANYGMATIKVDGEKISSDELAHYAYEGGKVTISKIDPLLYELPAYRLRDLIPFLHDKEAALAIMRQSTAIRSMKQFELWIAGFTGMSPEEVAIAVLDNKTPSIVGEPTRFRRIATITLTQEEALKPNWNDLLKEIELPDNCPRGFAVVVRIKVQEINNKELEVDTDEEQAD